MSPNDDFEFHISGLSSDFINSRIFEGEKSSLVLTQVVRLKLAKYLL